MTAPTSHGGALAERLAVAPLTIVLADDHATVDRLRRGEEAAFAELVSAHERGMKRVALKYVRDAAVAEEVVQDTWLIVFEGVSRFEGRSSLKHWIYKILVNRAKTRGKRDSRTIPFSTLGGDEPDQVETPSESRGHGADPHLSAPPWGHSASYGRSADDEIAERDLLAAVMAAIQALPPAQRAVIYLRDVRGLDAEEACQQLQISDGTHRVQLHRARTRVRQAIADFVTERDSGS